MFSATEAVSPDGRRVAKLTTEYFQTLHFGEESMVATVTVTDRETGEKVYVGRFHYDRDKRFNETGHEVTGIAFESDVLLLVGANDDHVERIPLPAAGDLSTLQVLDRTHAALAAAYGPRAALLSDTIRALYWGDGTSACRLCCPRERPRDFVCPNCREVAWRRLFREPHPPDVAMTLSEAGRALVAHAVDPDQVLAALSARASLLPSSPTCTVCGTQPAPSPFDFWSANGRACEACLRTHAKNYSQS